MSAKILSRLDVQQRTDRVTRAVTLRYVGRGLSVDNVLYGYPAGVFFAVHPHEIPAPDFIRELAATVGLLLEDHPDFPKLREYALEAVVSEAWVNAPELLSELAIPACRWLDGDRATMERKHAAAMAMLAERVRIIETDLRRRQIQMRAPSAPRATLGADTAKTESPPEAAVQREPPSAAMVERIGKAIKIARAQELPQRLPGGARRKLSGEAPGTFVVLGDRVERHASLVAALTSAAPRGSDEVEATVVDWDGEWPVVARRYGLGERVIYRLEEALRRAGIEEEVAA